MNPQMFNSFLDGTKSAIEMAAIANACGLDVPEDGLALPALRRRRPGPRSCGRARVGGCLERDGMVEVVSSLERDGRPVARDLRWGVYVVLKAPNDYAAACFRQYGLTTDATGRYAAMYKPFHLIGLELSISVLNAALRGEPTGCCARVARRCGGGRQARPQGRRDARRRGRLHGLGQAGPGGAQPRRWRAADRPGPPRPAAGATCAAGPSLSAADVELDESAQAVRVRREMVAEAGQADRAHERIRVARSGPMWPRLCGRA